ncbi:MAG: DUF4290 domain-containing protein [Bacteroidales bacterium]|nr:DUF4290 domain-containing protein [Bacteroidales bacterium]
MEIDYNTTRDGLIIKEYGRNVQELVKYALTIEDRDKRTKLAHIIISVMQQVNPIPTNSPTEEYFKKLWNHIYMISEYKLDVDYPVEVSKNEIVNHNPEHVDYSGNDITFRFYGKNTELILNGISDMDEGPDRLALLTAMANQMKEMYITWNKSIVGDELINKHIQQLTDGKLKLAEGFELISSNEVLRKLRAENAEKEKETYNAKKNYKKSAPKKKGKTFKKKPRY